MSEYFERMKRLYEKLETVSYIRKLGGASYNGYIDMRNSYRPSRNLCTVHLLTERNSGRLYYVCPACNHLHEICGQDLHRSEPEKVIYLPCVPRHSKHKTRAKIINQEITVL